MAESAWIDVEVAHCLAPREVRVHSLRLPVGACVADALLGCGCCADLEQAAAWRVGVWGRSARLDQVLRAADRVEIYRALKADPKESRRLRYRAQHTRPTRK